MGIGDGPLSPILQGGMVISGGSFLLNLIVSGVIAIFQPRLRKASIWIAAVSVVMLLGLVVLWRMA